MMNKKNYSSTEVNESSAALVIAPERSGSADSTSYSGETSFTKQRLAQWHPSGNEVPLVHEGAKGARDRVE